ncbi:hypothetical protein [Arthrobacter sp. YD2]|uniref:hypothetical protein n=1 Tax=Arthrobacter sp. YD2 TaxID=3058046 RepID=UPI0025B33C6F|nr:hypothetical protein [Arthrobacter sp. YD2]MDN3903312.1 hypothetical protein [Arthrobacter sp. YD2]
MGEQLKISVRVAASMAVLVSLAGCAGGDAVPASKSTASATASASATPSDLPDALARIPEKPFGLDPSQIAADPASHGIEWNLRSEQASDAADAIDAYLQWKWVENERNVFLGGPDSDKIQSSLEDAKHFAASNILESDLLARGQTALDFAKSVEREGTEAPFPEGVDSLWYPFHLGMVAAKSSADPAAAGQRQDRLEAWPQLDGRPALWITVGDESSATPYRQGDKVDLVPRIEKVDDVFPFANPAENVKVIGIYSTIDYEIPLVDGRTALRSYSHYAVMLLDNGNWKVFQSTFDAGGPVTEKQ